MYEGLWARVSVLWRIRTIGENLTNRKHLSGCCLLICPPETQLPADNDSIYKMTRMLFQTVSECCGAFFHHVNLFFLQEELYPQRHANFINCFIPITKRLIKKSQCCRLKVFSFWTQSKHLQHSHWFIDLENCLRLFLSEETLGAGVKNQLQVSWDQLETHAQ